MYDDKKFEDKSMWKKKGFYLSTCTALICLMAVGTVYYKMNYSKHESNISSSVTSPKPGGEASKQQNQKTKQAMANNNAGKAAASVKKQAKMQKERKAALAKKAKQEKKAADKKKAKETMSAGAKGSQTFHPEAGLIWPVKGDVIMKYSMKNTVYFKTLAQYKCNPAIIISAKKGKPVVAACSGKVTQVATKDETGVTVTVDVGGGYQVIYGQLANVTVKNNQQIKAGDKLGEIGSPTKFYSKEGANLYLQVTKDGKAVDPLLLLK